MMHGIKKIKVKSGRDANRMLIKKLLFNFLKGGLMVTTEKKAKILKTLIERMVDKAKRNDEASKNVLLKHFTNKKAVSVLIEQVAPEFKDRTGGYVRVIRLNQRENDGSQMSRVEWVAPIVIDWTGAKKVEKKTTVKKTKKAVEEAK
jgi:large subunit ribosomal protein L17